MAGLLLEQTERTFSTLLVVHSSFSYVKVLMMLTRAWGPPLARMMSYNRDTFSFRGRWSNNKYITHKQELDTNQKLKTSLWKVIGEAIRVRPLSTLLSWLP